MVAVGLLFFAGAIGSATALLLQNRDHSAIPVHMFNHTLTIQPYSILVAGAVIAAVALIGLALMHMGAGKRRRLRGELAMLRVEHARRTGSAADRESSFFSETFGDDPLQTSESRTTG